jgi:hypothetical protein
MEFFNTIDPERSFLIVAQFTCGHSEPAHSDPKHQADMGHSGSAEGIHLTHMHK